MTLEVLVSKLASASRTLRSRIQIVAMTMCLIPFIVDCWQIRTTQWQDVVFAVAYAIGLLGLLRYPLSSCVLLIAVQLGELLLPLDIQGPNPVWGASLAVGELAFVMPVRISAVIVVLLTFSVPLGYWLYSSSMDTFALGPVFPFDVAFAIGYVSRLRESTREERHRIVVAHEELERQRRQLELIHILHDSVAGSCSYSIMMCHKLRDVHEMDADASFIISDIENTLTRMLQELRNTVIRPMRSELSCDVTDDDAEFRNAESSGMLQSQSIDTNNGVTTLISLRRRQAERLAVLGFKGTIRCVVRSLYVVRYRYYRPSCWKRRTTSSRTRRLGHMPSSLRLSRMAASGCLHRINAVQRSPMADVTIMG